ncbi:MAG: anti-sigma B factor antagonist RsbV [Rhodobacteraceae bacterium HLUCCO18]|nr:MAG: anti-sigma B factor antagonist RsbV [Rhodobacteraceae bacterium HLUCCO18]
MNLSFETVDGVGVVRAHVQRIDAAVAIQFKDRFSDITGQLDRDAPGPPGSAADRTVLLDLTEVEFLDSSGLGAVVAARKLLGKHHSLALAGLQPAVEKVLRLTHMDRVFPIYADAEAFLSDMNDRQRA